MAIQNILSGKLLSQRTIKCLQRSETLGYSKSLPCCHNERECTMPTVQTTRETRVVFEKRSEVSMGNFTSSTDALKSLHSLDRDTEDTSEPYTCILMAQHSKKFLSIQVENEELFQFLIQEYRQHIPSTKHEEQSSISKIFQQNTFRLVQLDFKQYSAITPRNVVRIEDNKENIFFKWIIDKKKGYIYCALCPSFVLEAISPNKVLIQPLQSQLPFSLQQQWFITSEGYICSKAFEDKILGAENWSMKEGAVISLINFSPESSNNFKWKLIEVS